MSIGHNGGPSLSGDNGWVAIARSMREHPLVGFHLHARPADANRGAMQPALAFIDLIMECRYEDGTVMNGGRKMLVRRGELVGAISWLAARWNWTPKAVRGWLDRLEADGMIARFHRSAEGVETGPEKGNRGGNQAAITRLCNYWLYQSTNMDRGQPEGQAKGNQGASEGQAKGNIYKDKQGNKGTKEQEEREGASPPAADAAHPDPVDCLKAFNAYNELAQRIGLPLARSLTPQRRKSLAARLREHGGYDAWEIALANVERSAFLRGGNNRGWRADFDFLLQASRFAKVVDGTYGNGAHGDTVKTDETQAERMARLLGEIEQERRP